MHPLNIAIVGSGAIAAAHVDAYLALGEVARVVAIVSSDPARGRALAARTPSARVVFDVDEIIADTEVDGIDICGHTLSHAPTAVAALNAGKHVLIEKPPAITLDEFDRIAHAAEASNRVAMVGQTVRFQPAIASIIDEVRAGTIGAVSLVHINWYVAHVWPRAWRGWQLDAERSGGHLVHNGMHSIDLALRLLNDDPVGVFVRGWTTYSPDLPTPDSFHILMQCEQGGLAVLETSYGLRPPADPLRRIVVAGSHGTLAHSTAHETELFNPVMSAASPSTEGAMVAEIEAWLRAARGDTATPIPMAHSRVALAAAIAAQESAETGLAVPVSGPPTLAADR